MASITEWPWVRKVACGQCQRISIFKMAAPLRFLARARICVPWSSLRAEYMENTTTVALGVRYYRGSNRDTRRRERNDRARQRIREGVKPKIFDKREFIRINYEKEWFAFKSRLSLQSVDDDILRAALTHASYQDEQPVNQNNSKMSIIGYNLTTHYITEFLCFKLPNFPADGVRCLLDFLTSRETIIKVSQLIALPELIRTENDLDTLHQEKHVNYTKQDVISDAFYALIGAIYNDQGSQEAFQFIDDFLLTQLQGKELFDLFRFKDPENFLKDMLLAEGRPKPEPRIMRESGQKTHLPVFVVGIFSGDLLLAEAASYNIPKAKHEAMLDALKNLFLRHMKLEPSLPSSMDKLKPLIENQA